MMINKGEIEVPGLGTPGIYQNRFVHLLFSVREQNAIG
jgi:hypothetical protein